MDRVIDAACAVLDFICAALLAIMVVLVFGNVVLRYGFNSGIVMSEELSRWLFVWLTFLGAIVALRRHAHLGTDVLVSRLPVAGRKLCALVAQVLMLYVTWLLFRGSLEQARLNADVAAPVSGIPVSVFYASGVVFGMAALALLALGLWRLVRGRAEAADLVLVRDSEEPFSP